jgi:hypothetical protein
MNDCNCTANALQMQDCNALHPIGGVQLRAVQSRRMQCGGRGFRAAAPTDRGGAKLPQLAPNPARNRGVDA